MDTTPSCPGHKGGMAPTLGGEVGELQLQGLGGRSRQAGNWWRLVPSRCAQRCPLHPARPYRTLCYILISFFFNFLTFSLEKGFVRAPSWHPPPLVPAQRRGMALRGAEAPGAHLRRGEAGGRKGEDPAGPTNPQGKHSTCTEGRGDPAPSQAPPTPGPFHCGALRMGRDWRSSKRQVGKHHPRGPGEPEPGLGEGDVGRGLLFQVPKTEVTTPAPCGAAGGQGVRPRSGQGCPDPLPPSGQQDNHCPTPHPRVRPSSSLTFRGLCHGGTQAVHVVTPIAVVTKQQLVLGGETRPAGTLGARAPETGVGGGGRGQVKGAGGGGPLQDKGL